MRVIPPGFTAFRVADGRLADEGNNAGKGNSNNKKLSPDQREQLLGVLKTRFEKNRNRHEGLAWDRVQTKLEASPEKLWSLSEMERTGGEPDVVGRDETTGEYIFYDCSAESPKGRRSLCYDREALESRKEHKPDNSALDMAAAMGIEILTEDQYRELQRLGAFDTKTSSWIRTPSQIRKLGGASFVIAVTTRFRLSQRRGVLLCRQGLPRLAQGLSWGGSSSKVRRKSFATAWRVNPQVPVCLIRQASGIPRFEDYPCDLAQSGTTGGSGLLVPAEDTQRPQRVPPAGPAVAVLERKVDLAGMRVLQQPGAIGLLLGSEQIDRFVHPRVRRIPGRAEVFEGTQHVVVPAGRKRELQPGRVDDFAGALTPEQLSFEEVLLTPAPSRDGFAQSHRLRARAPTVLPGR